MFILFKVFYTIYFKIIKKLIVKKVLYTFFFKIKEVNGNAYYYYYILLMKYTLEINGFEKLILFYFLLISSINYKIF